MSNTIPLCSSFGSRSVHFRYAERVLHNENAQVLRAKQFPLIGLFIQLLLHVVHVRGAMPPRLQQ